MEADLPECVDTASVSVVTCNGVGRRCRLVSVLSSSPLNASRSVRPSASTASISARSSFTDWVCSPFRLNSSEKCLWSRVGVGGTDLKARTEYEDGGGFRKDLREVGVPPRGYSLIRWADISEPIELSLASLRKKCRGKVRVCTGDDVERGIIESEDVGGWDPGGGLNRRLVALRSNPEKVETIDDFE